MHLIKIQYIAILLDFAKDCLSRGITEKDLVNAYGEYFKNKKNKRKGFVWRE